MLQVENLQVSYGAVNAVKDVSFAVEKGEIVTVIGANGAGKSTIMRTLAGLMKAKKGSVRFDGKEILGASSHKILRMGLSLSPEGRQIFPRLTVLENLEMGAYTMKKSALEEGLKESFRLFPVLKERLGQMGGTLSGGEQQMLAVARALMNRPRLLIMDEPSLGLAPLVVRDLFALFTRINREGNTTILLVEQNARMALAISHRSYVLETGRIVLTDTSKNLLENEKVKAAYLGGL
jgi:branched-chain amino acid transport system ATP-binding protein